MKRVLLVTIAVLLAGALGALAFAPYLPRLAWEGSPELVMGDRGTYVEVGGAAAPRDLGARAASTLTPKLETMFTQSGGAALLLARQGELALEHYAPGYTADTRLNSFSMVKSLVGALLFKAIAEGKIGGLDQTLAEVLPELPALGHLSLRRLITMRAGIHFDSKTTSFGQPGSVKDADTFPDPFGPLARLHFEGFETIAAGLTADEASDGNLNYQNISTALLGAVLERAYAKGWRFCWLPKSGSQPGR